MDSSDNNFAVLGTSLVFFGAAYGLSYAYLYRSWRRSQRKRHEAASCTMGVLHGTAATAAAIYEISRIFRGAGGTASAARIFPAVLSAPNTRMQAALMEFSTAYFAVDLAHYLLFARDDVLFILHHVATSSYMLSCRYGARHGGASVMMLLAAGEVTSPLQNVWTICRLGRHASPRMDATYRALSPVFTAAFSAARLVVGPALVWQISRHYLSGAADASIPRWLVATWMAKSSLALVGSLVWVYKLWAGLIRFYGGGGGRISDKPHNKQVDDDDFVMNESLDVKHKDL